MTGVSWALVGAGARVGAGALMAACGAHGPHENAARGNDLRATPSASADAGRSNGTAGLDAIPMPEAPDLDASAPPGFALESSQEVAVAGTESVAISFAADGCVRVPFSAGAPVSATLGEQGVNAKQSALLGEHGPVCERAGKTLTLTFEGKARVRYAIWRTR